MNRFFKSCNRPNNKERDALNTRKYLTELFNSYNLLFRRIMTGRSPNRTQIKRSFTQSARNLERVLDNYLIDNVAKKITEMLLLEFEYMDKLTMAYKSGRTADRRRYIEQLTELYLKFGKLACLLENKPDCNPGENDLYKIFFNLLIARSNIIQCVYRSTSCNARYGDQLRALLNTTQNALISFIIDKIINSCQNL